MSTKQQLLTAVFHDATLLFTGEKNNELLIRGAVFQNSKIPKFQNLPHIQHRTKLINLKSQLTLMLFRLRIWSSLQPIKSQCLLCIMPGFPHIYTENFALLTTFVPDISRTNSNCRLVQRSSTGLSNGSTLCSLRSKNVILVAFWSSGG